MNVTTLPVGATGQFLEGVAVSTGVRESVILTSPSDANAFAEVVSTQPINFYGLPVWVQGTPSFSTSGNVTIQGTSSVNVLNPLSTTSVNVLTNNITSSIPFFVAQSSAPWAVNGAVAVTNSPNVNVTNVPLVTVQGTSSVNVISSAPHAITGTTMVNIVSTIPLSVQYLDGASTSNPTGNLMMYTSGNSSNVMEAVSSSQPFPVWLVSTAATVSTQVVSSVPFFVAQSSAPWVFTGSTQIVSSIPFFVAQSSGPWSVVGTTTPNVVSSIPYWVSQSSAPWAFSEVASTAGGTNATTIALQAHLNTTVVKASAGQVYGIFGSNIGSSNVFVRLYNISTAALTIASSAVPLLVFGMPISTSPLVLFDMAVAFNAGISLITQQQPYTNTSQVAPTASTATITILYK